MKPGTIIGGLIMAALGAAAWWGGTELTEPAVPQTQPGCIRLAISHSEDLAAGERVAVGQEVEMTTVADAVTCDGLSISLPPTICGGTLFIDLKEVD